MATFGSIVYTLMQTAVSTSNLEVRLVLGGPDSENFDVFCPSFAFVFSDAIPKLH